MVAGLLPKDQNLRVESSADDAFLRILDSINSGPVEEEVRKENVRLKEELAALKGGEPRH